MVRASLLANAYMQRFDHVTEDHHPTVDRMYEPVSKKAFGLTTADVIRALEQAARDGALSCVCVCVLACVRVFA